MTLRSVDFFPFTEELNKSYHVKYFDVITVVATNTSALIKVSRINLHSYFVPRKRTIGIAQQPFSHSLTA